MPLPERSAPVKCASCRRPFKASFTKCPHCGTEVQAVIEQPNALPVSETIDFSALGERAIAANQPALALEFHPAAVAALDVFFETSWGNAGARPNDETWRPSDSQNAIILNLGSFLGELIRREFNGRWETDSAHLLNSCVLFHNGLRVKWHQQVFLRLRDGATCAFEPLYLSVRQKLGNKNTPKEMDGWIRQAQHFDRAGRKDLALKFYERVLAFKPDSATRAKIEKCRSDFAAQKKNNEELQRKEEASKTRDQIATLAAVQREKLARLGIPTNTGTSALMALDYFLDETFGTAPLNEAARATLVEEELGFGALVGEILCERFNASWRETNDLEINHWNVRWPSGFATCPFASIANRFEYGSQTTVYDQQMTVLNQIKARRDLKNSVELQDEWFVQANAYASGKTPRLDLAVIFANRGLALGPDNADWRTRLANWSRDLKKTSI